MALAIFLTGFANLATWLGLEPSSRLHTLCDYEAPPPTWSERPSHAGALHSAQLSPHTGARPGRYVYCRRCAGMPARLHLSRMPRDCFPLVEASHLKHVLQLVHPCCIGVAFQLPSLAYCAQGWYRPTCPITVSPCMCHTTLPVYHTECGCDKSAS